MQRCSHIAGSAAAAWCASRAPAAVRRGGGCGAEPGCSAGCCRCGRHSAAHHAAQPAGCLSAVRVAVCSLPRSFSLQSRWRKPLVQPCHCSAAALCLPAFRPSDRSTCEDCARSPPLTPPFACHAGWRWTSWRPPLQATWHASACHPAHQLPARQQSWAAERASTCPREAPPQPSCRRGCYRLWHGERARRGKQLACSRPWWLAT